MKIEDRITKYLNEKEIIYYIERSKVFEQPNFKYDVDLFIKTLERWAGPKNVWVEDISGLPTVFFTVLDELTAKKVLKKLPVFKNTDPIIKERKL